MILVILGVIALLAGFFIPKIINDGYGNKTPMGAVKTPLKVVGALLSVIGVLWASYYSVPAGHRGVLLQFGAVQGVLDEGAHFITPFVQHGELIEVRTQKEDAKATAASKDLQTVQTSVAINYHVDPKGVGDLYKSVGMDFANRIIDPATQETVKAIVSKYTAAELITNRTTVKSEIDALLTERLAKYDLVVETGGVSLTNFDFSPEFNKAIEQKQVAQQEAEKAKYGFQKAEMEAKTAVAVSEGKAKAAKLEAEALNTLGGAKLLAKQWIDKWDGKLPTVSGGSGQNILDLRSLMGEAK